MGKALKIKAVGKRVAKKSAIKARASKKLRLTKSQSPKIIVKNEQFLKLLTNNVKKKPVASAFQKSGIKDKLSLLVLSSYRFPLDVEKLAIQSARIAGMAFVFLGAFFTMMNLPTVHEELVQQATNSVQLAEVDSSFGGEYQNSASDFAEINSEINVNTTPSVSLSLSYDKEKQVVKIAIGVAGASSVTMKAVNTKTGTLYTLGRASQQSADTWTFSWNAGTYVANEYAVYAEVTNKYGTYKSDRKNVTIEAVILEATIVEPTNQSTNTTDASNEVESEQSTAENESIDDPAISISVASRDALNGLVEVLAKTTKLSMVEFYVEPKLSRTPRFLGLGQLLPDRETWKFSWNTVNTPNGEYRLFAIGKNDGKKVTSNYLRVSVTNRVKETVVAPESVNTDGINQTEVSTENDTSETEGVSRLFEEVKRVEDEYSSEPVVYTTPTFEAETAPEPNEEDLAEIETKISEIVADYKIDIEAELERLKTAIRSGDEAQILMVKERIAELRATIIKNTFSIGSDELIAFVDRRLTEELKFLEERVEFTEKVVRERVGEEIIKDTDSDGITDFDELTLYKTDAALADTDNDGFLDGSEILNGFDPHDASPEAVLTYESPQESGLIRSDLLTVDTVEKGERVQMDVTPEVSPITPAILKGKGLPNSFVTLYIFSTPVVVTVKTDTEGAWTYTFDKELEDGEHEIYVGVTDNAGKIIAKSEPYRFVKTAEAFTPVASAETNNFITPTVPSEPGFLTENMILLVLSISIVAIGLLLLLLGLHLHSRKDEYLVQEGLQPVPSL